MRNADLEGLRVGIVAPFKAGDVRDIYGATPGTLVIENSRIDAQAGIQRSIQWGVTGGGAALPGRIVTVRNVRFTSPSVVSNGVAIFNYWHAEGNPGENPTVTDRLIVQGFNGVSTDNFEAFYAEQAGKGIAGGSAPCQSTRPEVYGFACSLGAGLTAQSLKPLTPTRR